MTYGLRKVSVTYHFVEQDFVQVSGYTVIFNVRRAGDTTNPKSPALYWLIQFREGLKEGLRRHFCVMVKSVLDVRSEDWRVGDSRLCCVVIFMLCFVFLERKLHLFLYLSDCIWL